ncbi:conserved hypothetical protein [Ricinus communis]|uniref:Uncharacterized protein n=1 Tax=Ricinus communis TaxID=3988 RepID=B9TMG8_RICCO|nr:conserved hypothetical protein [Ricinus communis]
MPATPPAFHAPGGSALDDGLEAAEDHALSVEGHVVHVRLEALVLHDLGHHLVALGLAVVGDPREHRDLVVLQMDGAGERGQFAIGHVVGDGFDIGQRAQLHPDRARQGRHLLVGLDIGLGHGEHETVDIGRFNAERPDRGAAKKFSARRSCPARGPAPWRDPAARPAGRPAAEPGGRSPRLPLPDLGRRDAPRPAGRTASRWAAASAAGPTARRAWSRPPGAHWAGRASTA